MGLKPEMKHEIEGAPDPLTAIPRPRWKIAVSFLPMLMLVAYTAFMIWVNFHRDKAGKFSPDSPWLWFNLVLLALAGIIALLSICDWARYPEFTVTKRGIRLGNTNRRPEWSSPWRLRNLGFYAWSEVKDCRWSHYDPGILFVHVLAVRSRNKFGLVVTDPPGRHEQRIAERHRPAVEQAIRALGKWAD